MSKAEAGGQFQFLGVIGLDETDAGFEAAPDELEGELAADPVADHEIVLAAVVRCRAARCGAQPRRRRCARAHVLGVGVEHPRDGQVRQRADRQRERADQQVAEFGVEDLAVVAQLGDAAELAVVVLQAGLAEALVGAVVARAAAVGETGGEGRTQWCIEAQRGAGVDRPAGDRPRAIMAVGIGEFEPVAQAMSEVPARP